MVIYLGLPSPAGSSNLPESRRAVLCFLFGLASDGVYICPSCYQEGGSLLHCPSNLTGQRPAVHFCCTILGVASTGRYPASCPAKPGLSSPGPFRSCQPRLFILLNTNVILTQDFLFVNIFYTSKHPPPINSRRSEVPGTASPGIPTK